MAGPGGGPPIFTAYYTPATAVGCFPLLAMRRSPVPRSLHGLDLDLPSAPGPEFIYENDNGNPAIDKRVLRAFRKASGDTVVWDR